MKRPLNSSLSLIVTDALVKRRRAEERLPDEVREPYEEYAEMVELRPVERMQAALDEMFRVQSLFDRQPNQVIFHEVMNPAKACMYFKETLRTDEPYIVARNNWSKELMVAVVYINCTRRVGKTTAVAISTTSDLAACPNCLIVVFAPSYRQACDIPNQTREMFLTLFPEMAHATETKKGRFQVNFGPHDTRVIWALPRSTDVRFSLSSLKRRRTRSPRLRNLARVRLRKQPQVERLARRRCRRRHADGKGVGVAQVRLHVRQQLLRAVLKQAR